MASEQNSLGPETNRLNFPDSSAEPLSLTYKELESLFVPLFDDTIVNRPSEVSPNSAAHLDLHQVPDSPQQTTTNVGRDGPPIASPTTTELTGSNSRPSAGDSIPLSVPQTAEHDPEAFFKVFFKPVASTQLIPDITESSTRNLDPAHMRDTYHYHPSTQHWI
jgi:hypothetical protein